MKPIFVKRKTRPTGNRCGHSLWRSDADVLMAEIEKWGAKNNASRSEAIRRLVELGLTAKP